MASSSSTTATYPARAYAQANPIDLTLEDDDDEDMHVPERMPKRQCTLSRSFNANGAIPQAIPSYAYSRQSPSGLSPAMSHSSLAPHAAQNATPGPRILQPSPSSSHYRDSYENDSANALQPQFQGPSNSSAFFQSRQQPFPPINPLDQPPSHPPQLGRNGSSSATSQPARRQVIDLTSSPSPPPVARPPQPLPQPPPPPQPMPSHGNLPMDLPPKTPVCIGVLNATALVLYPISYLNPPEYGSQESEWAPVRLQYEHVDNKPAGPSETINIRPPSVKGLNGEIIPGETFSVVEQKVATHLGPMLGKGLIRLDAKIRRGHRTLPILQLQMLVFTPKGNIPVVSSYLHSNGLYLDHPTLPCDMQHAASGWYYNPHNPPPGGHPQAGPAVNRPGYSGPGGNSFSRWSAPAVAGRSVEVQRSQVDELFKSLKGGDEVDEADPPSEVATKMYPHQLKALTFLLAREQEPKGVCRRQTSLWQERVNPLSHQTAWVNIVTQAEEFSKPFEAKGAILADDMGLGKTITCVSLIAATLRSARAFAETPLTPPPTPPPQSSDGPLTAAHFQGSVWGIPPPSFMESHGSSSSKASKKMAREQDRMDAQYTRACRIKMKSRATLIICPLSTVVNWEDQFKEHWRGEVIVSGGQSGAPPPSQSSTSGMSTPTGSQLDIKTEVKKPSFGRVRDGPPLRVYVYHGNARRLEPTFLADFDAVITTYSTLASEFSKQTKSLEAPDDDDEEEADGVSSEGFIEVDGTGQPITKSKGKKAKKRKKTVGSATEATSPLQSIHWFRVVLDEAHSIKETNTVGCRASCDLVSDRRLCLTGTPVQNKLDDVYALIKFLRLTPFDDKNIWNEFIGTPVKYAQPLGVARLQTIMRCITLRRTKDSRAEDGKKILSLPARSDELRLLKFDSQEQSIYDQFFNASKAEFHELSHKNEVMKNYVGILQKILRLRQICDHFELVRDKGLGLPGDMPASYEDIVAAVAREGINMQRGAMIFALLKEAGTTQCVECQCELSASMDATSEDLAEVDAPATPAKRGRKPKASASTSRASTRQNSPNAPQPVLTRCQHLFCADCFRTSIFPGWPNVPLDVHRACVVCQTALLPNDAVQLMLDCAMLETAISGGAKKKTAKKEKRQKGIALEDFHPSTKVRALLGDLIQFSKANPYSANYDPSSIEVQMVDGDGNCMDDGVTKTVVFSQWTTMLDKVEDALEVANIRYDRLDGTMKRDERTRAMEALKHDPGCEVLLVSLKAGGVGLNLTAAQRVYLMDPYWNPAVENQAVDRIHRLGQTRPVTTVKLIIENTIEARLLEVQKKKTELANLTLGPPLSKSDIQARRLEELQQLFAS